MPPLTPVPLAGYAVGLVTSPSGAGSAELAHALQLQGADVLAVMAQTSAQTSAQTGANSEAHSGAQPDLAGLRRLLDETASGGVDALVCLTPAAASALLSAASRRTNAAEVRTSLRSRVLAICPDVATAEVLAGADIPVTHPVGAAGHYVAALVELITEQLPALRGRRCLAAGHTLDVRGQAVVVDGELHVLPTSGMTLLRALAHQPGHVVSREKLLALLPGEKGSGHAVDVAIGRLRMSLGDPAIITTVVKRGYRLAVS